MPQEATKGRITVRTTPALVERVRLAAAREKMEPSMNRWVEVQLERAVTASERGSKPRKESKR